MNTNTLCNTWTTLQIFTNAVHWTLKEASKTKEERASTLSDMPLQGLALDAINLAPFNSPNLTLQDAW